MNWLPIESAPKTGDTVDLWISSAGAVNGFRIPDCFWCNRRERWHSEDDGDAELLWSMKPSHWMFPPDAPPEDA